MADSNRSYVREIAERTAQRYAGRQAPPVTAQDTGRLVPPLGATALLNDPADDSNYFVLGVDSFDDASKHF